MERIDYILAGNEPPIGKAILWLDTNSNKLRFPYSNKGWLATDNSSYPFSSIRVIDDYLCEISYNELDYGFAKFYFRSKNPIQCQAGCSSFRVGNLYCRNFDYYYDNSLSFVVRTLATKERYAVLGVAGGLANLTKKSLEHPYDDVFKILPFCLLDGVNENGLFCNINLVPADKGLTTATIPSIEKRDEICASMLVRYILDKFTTVDEAVDYITKYVSIYPSQALQASGYETHYMIGDSQGTYTLEFVNNAISLTETSILTNFFIAGVTFNPDGSVYTPADSPSKKPSVNNGITQYGSGLERYNLINEVIASVTSEAEAREVLKSLYYTNSYTLPSSGTTPFWYSEFVAKRFSTTVDSPTSSFGEVIEYEKQLFSKRDRNIPASEDRTWITSHSSIYSLDKEELRITSQEGSREYKFRL